MTSWREIDRIRKDATAFREIAARLLATESSDLTEWEEAFLENFKRDTDKREFSTRQAEKLLQIRDDAEIVRDWRGFSVATLLRKAWEMRSDLSEADEEWLSTLRTQWSDSVKRRALWRLVRIGKELDLIERGDETP